MEGVDVVFTDTVVTSIYHSGATRFFLLLIQITMIQMIAISRKIIETAVMTMLKLI